MRGPSARTAGLSETGGFAPPSSPLVSVIIPAFNAERFLAETLRSVSQQTYRNIEIIVVDDGSTDGTANLVEAQRRLDPRIRLIRQANAGVAAARNKGIFEASGEFLAPLDADDLWHPENLARQVAALQTAGPDAALCYAGSINIDDTNKVLQWSPHPRIADLEPVLEVLIKYNFIGNGSAAVMRRSHVVAASGYDPGLRAQDAQGCEDLKLYLTLAARHRIVNVPEYLIGYRHSADSMSRSVTRMERSHELVLADLRRLRPDLPERLFRHSFSFLHLYLSDTCAASGRKLEAWRHRLRAVLSNPAFMTEPHLVHWLAHILLGPLRRAAKFMLAPLRKYRRNRIPPAIDIRKLFRLI